MRKTNKCIVCGSSSNRLWAEKEGYKAVQCAICKMVWIDPLPSEKQLADFYKGYYKARVDDKISWRQRFKMYAIEKKWLENFIKGGRLLDIGSSDGSFLSNFGPKWKKCGIEYERAAVKAASKKGMEVKCGGPETISSFIGQFDCVILRGTIEHLPDPKKALSFIYEKIKPGGYLFITATPDASSFCAEIYREKWNQFTPPEHIYYFSVDNLTRLAGKFGLSEVARHHFYLETPYADIDKDYLKIRNDLKQVIKDKKIKGISPAFWGNMMTVLYRRAK